MPCPTNCSFDGSAELGTTCSLCEKYFHIKCIGLSSRVADQLRDGSKGLFWNCNECKTTGKNLVESYKAATRAFKDLSLELSSLQSKFAKLSAEFRDSNVLSEVESRDKSGSNKGENKKGRVESVESVVVSLVSPPPPPISCGSSLPAVLVADEGTASDTAKLPNKRSSPMVTRSKASSTPLPDTIIPPLPSLSPSPSLISPKHVSAEIKSSGVPTLKVVTPIKSVFVARLAPETSKQDIIGYMLAKNTVLKPEGISVRKFKFNYDRNSSSFRIFVPITSFKDVVSAAFWPKGSVVHEFKNKVKPKAAAPPKVSIASKN